MRVQMNKKAKWWQWVLAISVFIFFSSSCGYLIFLSYKDIQNAHTCEIQGNHMYKDYGISEDNKIVKL